MILSTAGRLVNAVQRMDASGVRLVVADEVDEILSVSKWSLCLPLCVCARTRDFVWRTFMCCRFVWPLFVAIYVLRLSSFYFLLFGSPCFSSATYAAVVPIASSICKAARMRARFYNESSIFTAEKVNCRLFDSPCCEFTEPFLSGGHRRLNLKRWWRLSTAVRAGHRCAALSCPRDSNESSAGDHHALRNAEFEKREFVRATMISEIWISNHKTKVETKRDALFWY